jgi:Ca-activated chloride channel family protein
MARRHDKRVPIRSTTLTVLVILSATLFLILGFAACRKDELPNVAPKRSAQTAGGRDDVSSPSPVPPPPPPPAEVGRLRAAKSAYAYSGAESGSAGYVTGGVVGGVVGGVPGGVVGGSPAAYTVDAKIKKDIADQEVDQPMNTEEYGRIDENPFQRTADHPLSTFSIDVDRASYSNVRRFLTAGQRPPRDAVRIEEMINYFTYDYPEPQGGNPFSVTTEVAACPWNSRDRLLLVGLQARRMKTADLPPSNLVFLVDVSGSMMSPDKLPLLKDSLSLLVDQLRPKDRVALVTYAGAAGLALPSTPGSQKASILGAIEHLEAGGSTAGGAGIRLAYSVAKDNFIEGANNRVILATDGDFNVGTTSDGELEQLIESKRKDGIFLTVLGFGTGNVKDSKMELLADKGNGNYAYIDTISEARKTLVSEMGATLFTVAKDVKLQIEFNPAHVAEYRLIGYENRLLRKEDFNDDTKDAGEIGAGHSVTALYELVPVAAGSASGVPAVDPLKYQSQSTTASAKASPELLTLKIRYKAPDGDTSRLMTETVTGAALSFDTASDNLRFAAAVAEVGMLLRDSKHKGTASLSEAQHIAARATGRDVEGYRRDFLTMVNDAGKVLAAKEVAEK